MTEQKNKLVSGWLLKAKRDIETAEKLVKGKVIYLDTAIYHCQQGAEKAIKGFLIFHDIRFEKTHDIAVLINLALPTNNKFSDFFDSADSLTPYATEYRYPGDFNEPSIEEFKDALKNAKKILEFILEQLPAKVKENL